MKNGELQRSLQTPLSCRVWPESSIIKPTAIIEEGCAIGEDVFIGHYCVIRPQTKIGDRTKIGHLTIIEGWCSIGEDCFIAAQSTVTKGMIIEDKVFFGMGVLTGNDKRMVHLRRKKVPFILDAPVVRYGARVGMGAILLPGSEVGRESFIAAGAVLNKITEPFSVYAGVPAKHIGNVPKEEWL